MVLETCKPGNLAGLFHMLISSPGSPARLRSIFAHTGSAPLRCLRVDCLKVLLLSRIFGEEGSVLNIGSSPSRASGTGSHQSGAGRRAELRHPGCLSPKNKSEGREVSVG